MTESQFPFLRNQTDVSLWKMSNWRKASNDCSHIPRRSCSARFISVINVPKTGEESFRRVSDDYNTVKWIIKKTDPIEFGPTKKAINWSNINALEQNKALEKIIAQQQQLAV